MKSRPTGPIARGRAPKAVSRFDLYEWCVQAPRMQALFLDALHGEWAKGPRVLRDDFCGPASIARAWAALSPMHRALGVDRDPEPLAHARLRAGPAGRRLTLEARDVLGARTKADVIAAFNFALCEIHLREDLVRYLTRARASLRRGGVLAADIYGGSEAMTTGRAVRVVPTPIGRVRYTWTQRAADPFSGLVRNAIRFDLPDNSAMPDAFVYHWRLWSVPELRDAMRDAGFASTEVHLGYGDAIDDQGRLYPRPIDEEEALDAASREAWVAYVVARTNAGPRAAKVLSPARRTR